MGKNKEFSTEGFFLKIGTILPAFGAAVGGGVTYAATASLTPSFLMATVFGVCPAVAAASAYGAVKAIENFVNSKDKAIDENKPINSSRSLKL